MEGTEPELEDKMLDIDDGPEKSSQPSKAYLEKKAKEQQEIVD